MLLLYLKLQLKVTCIGIYWKKKAPHIFLYFFIFSTVCSCCEVLGPAAATLNFWADSKHNVIVRSRDFSYTSSCQHCIVYFLWNFYRNRRFNFWDIRHQHLKPRLKSVVKKISKKKRSLKFEVLSRDMAHLARSTTTPALSLKV